MNPWKLKLSPHELYNSLDGLESILGGCRPVKDSLHDLYTGLEGLW